MRARVCVYGHDFAYVTHHDNKHKLLISLFFYFITSKSLDLENTNDWKILYGNINS